MATIFEVLALVEKDPVVGFVAIPVLFTKPPAKSITISLKGQRLKLPDWRASEWLWYGGLALKIAEKHGAPTLETDRVAKARLLARFISLHGQMARMAKGEGDVIFTSDVVGQYYDAAVRLVIASQAAATAPNKSALAVEAFKEAFAEAPQTIVDFLVLVLKESGNFIGDMVKASLQVLANIFEGATGLKLPSLPQIGTIALVGIGLWLYFNRKGA